MMKLMCILVEIFSYMFYIENFDIVYFMYICVY